MTGVIRIFRCRQIAAVTALCRGIMLRRQGDLQPHRVLGHSDVSPSRKKDPGEKFPWHSLANSGVGHWVMPAPIVRGENHETRHNAGDDVLSAAACIGAAMATAFEPSPASTMLATMEVVTAFQRHFRPERDSMVSSDHSTLSTCRRWGAETTAVATK
jgi:N-acetylmuramoyl-L-alanine amidase